MRNIFDRTGKFLQRICTPKSLAIGLTAIYLMSLIPLLLLGHYDYPSADDYTNGAMCYQAWQSDHSVGGLLAAAFQRTVLEWNTWRGCFSSAFLSALSPQVFGARFYQITPWLMLVLLTVSVFSLFYMLLVRLLGADRWTCLSVSSLSLFLLVQCTPGGSELFYWYSGAVNYTFLFGVSLLFYCVMFSLLLPRKKGVAPRVILASFLGFVVSGANQMTALNAAIVVTALLCFLIFCKKWTNYKFVTIPAVFFYLGFALSVAAPGNFVRAELSQGMNPIRAILLSFYYCLHLVIDEWLTWPVILVLFLMIPLFWQIGGQTKFKFPCPFLVLLSGFCLVSAMMTPPLFAVGNVSSGRAQGTVFLMFIPVLTLCTGYLTGWIRKKQDAALSPDRETAKEDGRKYSPFTCFYLAGCLIFLAFGILLTLIPSPRYFTFGSAAADCLNGSGRAYAEAQRARAALYEANAGQWVEVAPLEQRPELLFNSDITENADDWTNRGVARFYGLEGVVIRTAAPLP